MAKNKNSDEEIEGTKRLGDFPAAMPDDEQPEEPMLARSKEQAKEVDEAIEFETDEDTGEVSANFRGLPINPSSHYPGRNAELAEHNMALPTEIDLAKRAQAAGSQVPARVFAAGLADVDGNIDVGDAGAENAEEPENADENDNDQQ